MGNIITIDDDDYGISTNNSLQTLNGFCSRHCIVPDYGFRQNRDNSWHVEIAITYRGIIYVGEANDPKKQEAKKMAAVSLANKLCKAGHIQSQESKLEEQIEKLSVHLDQLKLELACIQARKKEQREAFEAQFWKFERKNEDEENAKKPEDGDKQLKQKEDEKPEDNANGGDDNGAKGKNG